MNELAISWLVRLVTTLVVAAASYWAGDHNRNNAWLAKQTTVATTAHVKYEKEEQRGNGAASNLADELKNQQARYTELEGKFHELRKRTPLVVTPLPETNLGAQALGSGPVLSNGAVWMWNSALAGADQPADTCGAADSANSTCASASGLTLGDAWDNHTTNAKSCAEDRLRHQRLIDFLKSKPP